MWILPIVLKKMICLILSVCYLVNLNSMCMIFSVITGGQTCIFITAVAVIFCASFRLLIELIQLCVLRLRFLLNWGNLMEIILFTFSIVYGWVFHSPCLCPTSWQWQIGAIAVFLAWIDLILFFAKFPQIGIYSLIFVKILSTFCKAVFVSTLLVIAFALALYMSFYEPAIMVSPYLQ